MLFVGAFQTEKQRKELAERKTNGAENSLRKKFEANRSTWPEFSVIESDE
jgi:hypothetical protein